MAHRLDALGMTQDALAAKVGITPSAVGHWINGRRTPLISQFETAAKVLQCTPEWLIYGVTADVVDENALRGFVEALEWVEKDTGTAISADRKLSLAIGMYNKYISKPPSINKLRAEARKLIRG